MRESWLLFALGSALFEALTAIFGKLGVVGINSNLATFIRTLVIVVVIAGIVSVRQEWEKPAGLPLHSWVFLVLSGIATGLSWLCYYRALQLGPVSKVAPIDKLERGAGDRVRPAVSRRAAQPAAVDRRRPDRGRRDGDRAVLNVVQAGSSSSG
ncbi:hypothetical protein RLIN73S_06742 [Rhodanobacter lindaniclasticus]